MSGMVISSVENFVNMSGHLEDIGISNIHFYNSKNHSGLDTPMIALVPFLDFLILGDDAHISPSLQQIVSEAHARHIPVLKGECIKNIALQKDMGC